MNKQTVSYYLLFGITFLFFNMVQDYIRPNYAGDSATVIYFLGIIPNFMPGIGLPALFYVVIPELFRPSSFIFRHRLWMAIGISMAGLIANEFITIITPGVGVFDWHDVLWTLIGGLVFFWVHQRIQKSH